MRKPLFILITLLMCWQNACSQSAQEWRDSLFVLNRYIEANPKSIELRMRKAEANIMLEQWYYALDEYTTILDMFPKHIGALYFRAFVNNKLRKYAFARQDYEKVLAMDPEHKGALTGLVFVNMSDSHLIEAYDCANHLVSLYPNEADVYAIRSQVEESRGLLDAALDDISKAISIMENIQSKEYVPRIEDDYTQYMMQRIYLYERKNDKKSRAMAESDKKKLTNMGLPSGVFNR